jgi:diguanylate cyclase (GGDEF)-like protein
MNILVVEPSKTYSKIIKGVLSSLKVNTNIASSGKSALAILAESSPDAICVAHELGDMNSLKFINILKQKELFLDIPKFLITSNNSDELRKKSYAAGYTEIFSKSNELALNKSLERILLQTTCHIKARILYVEDVLSTAQYTMSIIKSVGWDVVHTQTAEEAVDILHEDDNFDLIITDLILPGKISGMSLIHSIREQEHSRNIPLPIMALSGWNDVLRQIYVLQQGANDFVSKPFVESDFLARCLILIQNKKLLEDSYTEKELLTSIAHYDVLTNLPNRTLMMDRLHQAISLSNRDKKQLAFVFIDLDGFKNINDSYGHDIGDKLLMTVARRMKESLRESDTLSRIGGDEFVAILPNLVTSRDSKVYLYRLLEAASKPVHIDNLIIQVSASMGVAFYPQIKKISATLLMHQADEAMYQAKQAGKNQFQIFNNMEEGVEDEQNNLLESGTKLDKDNFILHFQPKVNMRTGKVVGADTVIRWLHFEKGLLLPSEFLSVIKEHSQEIEMGDWIIENALKQMSIWAKEDFFMPLSVNISASQIQQHDFINKLQNVLHKYPNVNPVCLELEIIEARALEDIFHISEVINTCHKLGISFTLDNFGTGYSSLTYLKQLPVTKLKIDSRFVCGMLHSVNDFATIEGALGLARAFRLQVIAKGVESVSQGIMLLQQGCEQAQGNYIAHPMPAEKLPAWLETWKPEPQWLSQQPISRDDLPLLFASVDHRAWINAIKDYLKDENNSLPPLDTQHCRFGKWLKSHGKRRYGGKNIFQDIENIHQQIHLLATEIIDNRAYDKSSGTMSKLNELDMLRDNLLDQLNQMFRKINSE